MTATDCRSNSRPWYKPYFTTAIAVGAVGAALIYTQLDLQLAAVFFNMRGTTTCYDQGWPATCFRFTVTTPPNYGPKTQQSAATPAKKNRRWITTSLLADIIASLLVIASTVFACERWRRRDAPPWQFSLRSLLIFTAMTAVLLYLYRKEPAFYLWWLRLVNDGPHLFPFGRRFWPWYIVAPMVFGIACAIYMLISTTLLATFRLLRVINGWRLPLIEGSATQHGGEPKRLLFRRFNR